MEHHEPVAVGRDPGLLGRRAAFAAVVAGTWFAGARWIGAGNEAFWLLVPVWTGLGALAFRAIPPPPPPARGATRWLVAAILVAFPAGFYLFMAHALGGRVIWTEILLAIWFFALSLEIVLLYLFAGFRALEARLSRGRGRAGAFAAAAVTKLVLYFGILIPFILATFSMHRVKVAPFLDADLGLRAEEVSFLARSERPIRLSGWFFPRPRSAGTVIACHGLAAHRGDLLGVIWTLRRAGFQVLAFDFRGHGLSDGHTVTFGPGEREDILGAWDWLLTRPDVDRDRIFGFGVSMGAAALLLALPDLPEMRAAIADSAFSDLRAMVRHQYRFVPGYPGRVLAGLTEVFGWIETGLWVSDTMPIRAIGRVSVPIFFLHGLDDTVVPPSSSERLHAEYRGPKRLRLEPRAGHGGTLATDPDRYGDEAREFFLEALRASPVR